MPDLKYPIGRFIMDAHVTEDSRRRCIDQIAETPERLRKAVAGLTEAQLDTPYRASGWSVRQVVHHLPDSHLNSYVRFKLALTEDEPLIKPYDEKRWAELPDGKTAPVELSLALIESLHARWVKLLEALSPADFARSFRHPELGVMSLDGTLQLYAWHGRHHTAQIQGLRERRRWR